MTSRVRPGYGLPALLSSRCGLPGFNGSIFGNRPTLSSPRTETLGAVSRRMAAQRTTDTAPEMALRRELHRRGYRYRVHRRPLEGLRRRADIVFGPARVAVFVHGCFWHGCANHGTWPKSNASFWREKIERNQERDTETIGVLRSGGWEPVVIWEHDDPDLAADRVGELVDRHRRSSK